MGRISKESEKTIINKAVELAYDGISTVEAQKRLFDFSAGLFADGEESFIDVYTCIRRAILTVQAVLEEVKGENYVESEDSIQKRNNDDSREYREHDIGFSAKEITRLP